MSDADSTEIERLKQIAGRLFDNSRSKRHTSINNEPNNNYNNYNNHIFTKETFVLSEEDLQMINGDVEKQLVINEFRELDGDDVYPEEYDDENGKEYDHDNGETHDDYELAEEVQENGDYGEYYTELERVQYKPEEVESEEEHHIEKEQPHEPEKSETNIESDIESDAEYDNTHFLYDPPLAYKERFLVYLFKSSPILLVVVVLFIILSVVSENSFPGIKNILPSTFSSTPNANLTPFLTHKIYILEEDVKSLRKLQNLDEKVKNIESEFYDLKEHITKLEIALANNDGSGSIDNSLTNPLFEKLNQLESKVESLSKDINEEDNTLLKDIQDQLNKLSNQNQVKSSTSVTKKETKMHRLKNKYYNIANKCRIVRQLTSYPPLSQYKREKRRKTIKSRIIHGFPDFINRVLNPSKSAKFPVVNTLANIKLLSYANSPTNVLSEQPTLFWQNVASSVPIYFTVSMPEPINIHELGIYHSRQQPDYQKFLDDDTVKDVKKRWYNTAPKDVEFLVRPISTEQREMKESLSDYYNQDLKFNMTLKKVDPENLQGWVRVGQIKYDINSNRAYQPLIWNSEMKSEMEKWSIEEVMVIIHSNWGDKIVVLDTLRIFQQLKEDENADTTVSYRGLNDNHRKGYDHGEVLFLGEG